MKAPRRRLKDRSQTPVRRALLPNSSLLPQVKDGVAAVKASHRQNLLAGEVHGAFADSLDMDAALLAGRESEHRWDYLLGHENSGQLIALEPHSAKMDQVGRLIEKKNAAMVQLKAHLKPGKGIGKCFGLRLAT